MVHAPAPLPQPAGIQSAIIPLLIWLAYFLLPADGGMIDGIPLGRVETAGVILIVWIAAHRVRLGGATAVAAVTAAAVIGSAAVPGERGLHARYYATAAAGGAHERSTDSRDRAFTRVEERLDFVRDERDFHLGFFNDHTRFNFMRMGEPDRRKLEFAVAWSGWWRVRSGAHTLYVAAPGASAAVSVDASPVLSVTGSAPEASRELMLTGGWHRVHITFSSPYGAPRAFSAGEIVDGARQPFDRAQLRTERIDARQQMVASVLGVAKPIADLVALAWLSTIAVLLLIRRAGELWQRGVGASKAAFAVVLLAGAAEALRFAWPWTERFLVMVAGDDPMTYEGYARDILFNGILMNGGLPPGQGEPFYYQAFYPYFLALSHAVFGEGMFGILFLQRFLVAVTAVLLTRIAMRLRGDAVWPIALLVSGLFAWWKFAPIAADLLNESLYIPLLLAWLVTTLGLCARPSAGSAATTGAIGGLAAITRSTAMLSWVLVWPALFVHLRRTRGRARIVTLLIGCTLAVFSLIGIRNAIVSHRFALTSTELGVTLRGGNEPPPGLVLDPSPRMAIYERLGIGGYTIEVIEYAITAPASFAANIGRKALFGLGVYEPYAPGWGYSPVYIATSAGAVFGLLVAIRSAGPQWIAALIPLLIALTQYAAVVIVYPKGERLILPVHSLLLPYAAIAAYELWARASARFR